jgi:hypothetical protein
MALPSDHFAASIRPRMTGTAVIAIINGNITNVCTAGTAIPAMAKPLPFNRPWLFEILTRLIIPQIIAGIPVNIAQTRLSIPNTNDVIANLLVLPSTAPAGGAAELSAKIKPHPLQTSAPSAFSTPHLEQYIIFPFN